MHPNNESKQSAIDRITDPENLTNYLCGYSIRICTLYILWIHVVSDCRLSVCLYQDQQYDR